MCGIAGIVGSDWTLAQLEAMVESQHHRGPDARGIYATDRRVGLGHNRLSIIDLSPAAQQPMHGPDERLHIVFNGEIYNYLELRRELADYPYRSRTDTEVILAAYSRWGEACVDHLIGMFAFLIWDEVAGRLFAARDRFGVKPLYYHHRPNGTLLLASEIKALHAGGVAAEWDPATWATYLTHGTCDHSERTFWSDIFAIPPGHTLTWYRGQTHLTEWYDLSDRVGPELDSRPEEVVKEEYLGLMTEAVRLRFRSDVPVGINLSGGLDSSLLLAVVEKVRGPSSDAKAFTFVTGDPNYDELPWVRRMLGRTRHQLSVCRLDPSAVPSLAESMTEFQDEPFGGIPTLAYSQLFAQARSEGVLVVLDGQGMDEQWAGYDYYLADPKNGPAAVVQSIDSAPVRPKCLAPQFRALARRSAFPEPFSDHLRNLQYRDLRYTKIPRALRFNDRISMRSSTELREPFLDHRLVELALCQPADRKLRHGTSKWLVREIARDLLPAHVGMSPKRPVQTPQREWLRGSLRDWATACIDAALSGPGGIWLDPRRVRTTWRRFCDQKTDNSFYVWQWISLGLATRDLVRRRASVQGQHDHEHRVPQLSTPAITSY